MGNEEPIKYIRKVCLVGDPAVGKTSLVRRYVLDQYDDSYISTLGAKVVKKDVSLRHNDKDYLMSINPNISEKIKTLHNAVDPEFFETITNNASYRDNENKIKDLFRCPSVYCCIYH